jgi:hypothetical protein
MTQQQPHDQHIRPYTFHGVEFEAIKAGSKDAYGTCPFCKDLVNGVQKGPKFSVRLDNGQFRCFHCNRTGNTTSFMQQLHEFCLTETTDDLYEQLASHRPGITAATFKQHGFAYYQQTARWLIPVYSAKDKVINLRSYVYGHHPCTTSGIPHQLLGLNRLSGRGPILLAEGDWDWLAMDRLRKSAKLKLTVLGVPGSSVFKKEWVSLFAKRDVFLCYDHDSAGEEGTQLVVDTLGNHPASIHRLAWPTTCPDGYDLRDLIHNELDQLKHKPEKVWQALQRMFVPVTVTAEPVSQYAVPATDSEPPLVRNSFVSVLRDFHKHRHLTDDIRNGLAIMFATVLSIQLPGDPLWMFVVGPPGCLSGDTPLVYRRNGSKRNLTVEELFWSFKTSAPDTVFEIPYMDRDGYVRSCVVRDVVYSGQKEVFLLRLKSGKSIKATADHRFWAEGKKDVGARWKRLSDLTVGDDDVFVQEGTNQGNDALVNLEAETPSEHATTHVREENLLRRVVRDEVVAIRLIGTVPTFDVCVDEPHNFLANGIVVHNSGKTLFLQSFARSPWCVFKSQLTAKSLISGFATADGEDPSLIPQLQGKVLILKDYTEIITMQKDEQESMYGILRGAFDGRAEKTFGNGITRVYNDCHFAMLAGVTDVIHQDNRACLGERFLKYQLVDGDHYDQTAHITAAITGMARQVEAEQFLQRVTTAFSDRYIDSEKIPKAEPWVINRIISLTQVVAHIRATVPFINRGDLAYRPTVEIGTRIGKQLIKLGQCLAVVLGKSRIDKTVYRLMERVAFDTARGWSLDICRVLAAHHPHAVTREDIMREADMPSTTTHRRLESMLVIGTVVRASLDSSGQQGRPGYGWTLSPEFHKLWMDAKIES